MAYILVPPLPPGARKSDYAPLDQLRRTPERSNSVKDKVRAGDNSGSSALAAALQDAFKNNASGSGRTDSSPMRKGRGKRKAVEPVETIEVVDDEDEDDEAEARNQGSATLAHALDAAFAHNSANPNVAAVEQSGSTRHLRRSTRADFGSISVEIDVPPPGKRPRGRPRVTTNPDDDHNDRSASAPVSHRPGEKRQPQTPSGPQKKRRRVTRRGDVHDSEDDGEVEILDDASPELRRSPRRKPRPKADPPPRPKPRRIISQHRRASMPSRDSPSVHTPEPAPAPPSPPPTPPPQSPPATPPPPLDDNMLSGSGHPLTILPVPSPTGIVIAPRALNHLPASPGPPDPRQNRSLQGFHGEEAATGAHGLLESPATAAAPMDSSLCALPIPTTTATTTTNADLQQHHHHPLDIGLDIVVPMDMDIGDVEQQQDRQDAVRTAGVPAHALRISSSTHPDGPMLGFALSEHDDGPGPASLSADADTEPSSDGFGLGLGANTGPPDMDFIPPALNSYFNDWGAAGPSTGVVATGDGDEYVGDGTIDPSVLGGCPGAGSPCKLFRSDTAESSLRGFAFARPLVDDDVGRKQKQLRDGGEEQDVTTDGDFVPSAAAAATKGRVTTVAGATRARTRGGGRIGAGGVRIRTKTWRKALADENENSPEDTTDDAADDDDVERCLDVGMPARRGQRSTSSNLSPSEVSASLRLQVLRGEEKTFCHHCRCKSRRPKMRCTFIRESTGVQCRKLYCDACIEKRYVTILFTSPPLLVD